ncbi:PAAR domain-containing protein [Bosea rubneri]|uniref:PAAR domain-containing protein n=1 Tax=Bosea rubneri TaxID=3075434 RepID=A0ABU3SC81_9HYPH|nr:PAAR domain-containing protein [Bosea sp. ZW T0_25]MDU0342397.1 PAAR domain-containing protein [Bosea sp. ZW T0_25]
MVTVLVPHVGGPIIPACCPTVLIGGLPAARVTDICTCVGPPDVIVQGSATVFIGGLPAARMGDMTAHGGVIVTGMPTVLIGDSGGAGGGVAKPQGPGSGAAASGRGASGAKPKAAPFPESLPAKASDAPDKIALPPNVNKAMKDAYANSFPNGKSQENGATLVSDGFGTVKVVNSGKGESGSIQPNRSVGTHEKIIGTFHTHPYDSSEGGHGGVSFSSADIYYAATYNELILVDAGDKQFMMLPTKETPQINNADLTKIWNDSFKVAIENGRSFQDASSFASSEAAKKYKMAYYEGSDGNLSRITP